METTLGECSELIMGQSPPGTSYNENGDGLPFIQGSAEFGPHHPTPVKWCSDPRKIAAPGDVLLSVRAPVGDTNVADQKTAIGRGLAIVRGKDGMTTAAFLRAALEHGTEKLLSRSSGGMFTSITGAALRALPIAIPPLDEQRRIVDLVGALDETIAAAERQTDLLATALGRARDRLPDVDLVPLSQVLLSIESGTSTKPVSGSGPRLSQLTLAAIRPGSFRPGERKDVGSAALPEKARLCENDLLITRSNTPDRVGYVALARDVAPDTFIPDLVWRLVPDETVVSKRYLEQALSSPRYRAIITATASGTSQSMRKINKTNFSGIRIPLPSSQDQQAYVAPLLALADVARGHERLVDNLRDLRSNLLTALLSGEHPIPESYDELMGDLAA